SMVPCQLPSGRVCAPASKASANSTERAASRNIGSANFSSKELVAHRNANQFADGIDAQLVEQIGAVAFHGAHAETQYRSRRFVGFSFGEKAHDRQLAHREEIAGGHGLRLGQSSGGLRIIRSREE